VSACRHRTAVDGGNAALAEADSGQRVCQGSVLARAASSPAPVPGRSLGQSPGADHMSPLIWQATPHPGRSLGQIPGADHTPVIIARPRESSPDRRWSRTARSNVWSSGAMNGPPGAATGWMLERSPSASAMCSAPPRSERRAAQHRGGLAHDQPARPRLSGRGRRCPIAVSPSRAGLLRPRCVPMAPAVVVQHVAPGSGG